MNDDTMIENEGADEDANDIVMSSNIHTNPPDTRRNKSVGNRSLVGREICQTEFERSLIDLVIDEMLPLSFVESQAFRMYTNCE